MLCVTLFCYKSRSFILTGCARVPLRLIRFVLHFRKARDKITKVVAVERGKNEHKSFLLTIP